MFQTNQVDSNVSQTPNSHPGSQDEAPVVKDCYYFLTTGCTKGDKCPFRHKPEVKEVNMLCAKFLKGTCHDPNCKFIHLTSLPSAPRRPHHPTERHPQTMGAPVQKECIYFKQGRCKNGDHCPYLHVTPDNAALTQQLAAIINLVQNQARGTQLTNKRSSPFNQPAKRIQVMGADGSDSLGFDAPDTKRPLQERAARVKYQVGKMMEGHAGKQARRETAPAQKTSTTDFVVRTRAQILADQKAQEEKEKAAKAPAPATVAVTAPATVSTIAAPAIASTTPATVPTTPAPATTTPVSSVPDSKNDNSFDEDPEDEGAGDDSDFKDDLAEIDRIMGSSQS